MFESIIKFFKNKGKKEEKKEATNSKTAAKERLHLVLMQDRANVSADFLELMKQEIIEVIKKYIDVDEEAIDVHLTNKENEDGTNGAPALYANIPILNIKNEARKIDKKEKTSQENKEEKNQGKIANNKENQEKNQEKTLNNKENQNKNTQNQNENKQFSKEEKSKANQTEKKEDGKNEKIKNNENLSEKSKIEDQSSNNKENEKTNQKEQIKLDAKENSQTTDTENNKEKE